MGLQNCQIQLDNPWSTYYAGQTINGQVTLTFDSPKKVRGIFIRFLGEANVSWSEQRSTTHDGKTETETEYLTAHEEYFNIGYYLLGGKNSPEIVIPAGTHTYPFTCILPPTLPSSFEGEHGHVRYTVKVTLDRPWKFDQDIKMAFTVISPIDLNQNPRLKEPHKLELEKSFCCCCCRSGPLAVVVHVPVTGYVSGQRIPITCECDNASNVHIDKIKFELRKNVAFHSTQPRRETKRDDIVIAQISVGPVEANDSKSWSRQFEIPPLPPSNLTNCGIIDLDYELYVEVDVSGPHMNLDGKIPIVLGTIPLISFNSPPPYSDNSVLNQDISSAPTQPVSPVSPPNANAGGAVGWSIPGSSGDHSAFANMRIKIKAYGIGKYNPNPINNKGSQSEKFKIYKSYVLGAENGPDVEIVPGTYKYDIHILLPDNLPSSFEGEKGYIKYSLEVIVDEAWAIDDVVQKEFKIASHIDLNLDPQLREPLNYKMEKNFFSLFKCCTGPLMFEIHLPHTGFVQNTPIPINAKCINKSDLDIKSIRFVLRQRNDYCQTQVCREMVKIAEKDVGPVEKHSEKEFETALEIPPMTPISTLDSKLFFINYDLLIRLVVNPMHRDLRGIIPIAIGTIPFIPDFQPPPNFQPKVLMDRCPLPPCRCCVKYCECYEMSCVCH